MTKKRVNATIDGKVCALPYFVVSDYICGKITWHVSDSWILKTLMQPLPKLPLAFNYEAVDQDGDDGAAKESAQFSFRN